MTARSPRPPLHLWRRGFHHPDGMKMDGQPSRSCSVRDRATAWLREETPSLR